MALTFDAVTPTSGTTDLSATHTPVGTPRAVVVLIVQDGSASDLVAGVTYGGVALTRFPFNAETTGELGATYIYFLGSGIPTGPQTFAVDQTGAAQMVAWCETFTATADTSVVASIGGNADSSNPSVTVPTLAGFDGIIAACLFSGVSAVGTPVVGSGYTERGEFDFTAATVANTMTGAKTGADVVANWTIATSDDWSVSAAAVAEVSAAGVGARRRIVKPTAVHRASRW